MNHDTTKVTAFGCGCNKKIANASAVPGPRRVTVYQVQDSNNNMVAEFDTLPQARAKAVEVSGRVKVASKVVEG